MRDKRDAPIHPGDFVIWIDNRALSSTGLYKVLDSKIKVKIGTEDGSWSSWVFGDSVIVVDALPYVEGKRNMTPKRKGTKAWQKLKESS